MFPIFSYISPIISYEFLKFPMNSVASPLCKSCRAPLGILKKYGKITDKIRSGAESVYRSIFTASLQNGKG